MSNTSESYMIIKFYEDGRQRVIRRGLDREEARAICNDPETSSMTARKPAGCAGNEKQIARWHESQKHWFYGFDRED